MKTIISYLQSKTVQGILGLVILGIMKTQNIHILGDELMGTLMLLFGGWAGIGIRNAMKQMNTNP